MQSSDLESGAQGNVLSKSSSSSRFSTCNIIGRTIWAKGLCSNTREQVCVGTTICGIFSTGSEGDVGYVEPRNIYSVQHRTALFLTNQPVAFGLSHVLWRTSKYIC